MKNKDIVKPGEFRRNNARTGHPAYIVKIDIELNKEKQSRKKVKFIGITEHSTTHQINNIPLKQNPNPKTPTKPAYIRPKLDEVNLTKKTFGKVLLGWKFVPEDKEKVNRVIKQKK